jgi:hypothetical protein
VGARSCSASQLRPDFVSRRRVSSLVMPTYAAF